jgi:hypothetical protein
MGLLADGRVAYALQARWRSGDAHRPQSISRRILESDDR